jgi:hypothetical protein
MGRLEGRIAIVTGAASGLGLATSKPFAAEGATVVMVDRREDEVRRAAEGGGKGLDPIGADITRSAHLAALRDHIATSYGRADVLFANAGRYIRAVRRSDGGRIRPDHRDQPEGHVFHGADAAASPARRRLGHPHFVHGANEGPAARARSPWDRRPPVAAPVAPCAIQLFSGSPLGDIGAMHQDDIEPFRTRISMRDRSAGVPTLRTFIRRHRQAPGPHHDSSPSRNGQPPANCECMFMAGCGLPIGNFLSQFLCHEKPARSRRITRNLAESGWNIRSSLRHR